MESGRAVCCPEPTNEMVVNGLKFNYASNHNVNDKLTNNMLTHVKETDICTFVINIIRVPQQC